MDGGVVFIHYISPLYQAAVFPLGEIAQHHSRKRGVVMEWIICGVALIAILYAYYRKPNEVNRW